MARCVYYIYQFYTITYDTWILYGRAREKSIYAFQNSVQKIQIPTLTARGIWYIHHFTAGEESKIY